MNWTKSYDATDEVLVRTGQEPGSLMSPWALLLGSLKSPSEVSDPPKKDWFTPLLEKMWQLPVPLWLGILWLIPTWRTITLSTLLWRSADLDGARLSSLPWNVVVLLFTLKKKYTCFWTTKFQWSSKNKNFLPFHSHHLFLFPELVKFPFSIITFYRALVHNADHILLAFIS